MYLGDPRESLVDFEAPGVWEADNRVEERWQWGAQVLDLCGLSPEEYKNSTAVTVKTIQDCGECGGGGGQISENKGSADIDNDGLFSVSFELPVASPLYVFVTFTDDNGDEYSFKVKVDEGSDNATFDISTLTTAFPFSIDEVKVGFKEDGSDASKTVEDKSYEYSVTYSGGGDEDGMVYAFSILCTKTDTLTGDDYQAIIDAQGQGFDYVAAYDEANFAGQDSVEVGFVAPGNVVEQYMPEDVEQQYFNEHSYDFVFITKKAIVEIKEDFTTDTDNWEKEVITVGGEKSVKWMRRDLSGSQCPYSIEPDPCDDYELTYTLNIKK